MIRCRFSDSWPGTGTTHGKDGKGWQPLLWARQGCAKAPHPAGPRRTPRSQGNDKTWAEMPEKGRFLLSPVASGEGPRSPEPPWLRCPVLGVSETFPSQGGMFLSSSPGQPRLPAMALLQTKINLVFVCLLWQFS